MESQAVQGMEALCGVLNTHVVLKFLQEWSRVADRFRVLPLQFTQVAPSLVTQIQIRCE